MTVDLTEEEREALIDLLTDQIQSSGAPLAPRVLRWKRIRDKLRGKPLR